MMETWKSDTKVALTPDEKALLIWRHSYTTGNRPPSWLLAYSEKLCNVGNRTALQADICEWYEAFANGLRPSEALTRGGRAMSRALPMDYDMLGQERNR
jgi:hypothetical protein